MQWLSKYYPSPQWLIKVIQWCRQNRIVFLNSLLGYKMRLMTAFYVRASFHLQLFCWTCASLATERKADEDVFHLSLRLNVKITIICTESRVDFQKVTNRDGRYSYTFQNFTLHSSIKRTILKLFSKIYNNFSVIVLIDTACVR